MKRQEQIAIAISDCMHNEPYPLMNLIEWLVEGCQCDLNRLILIAERRFCIPETTLINTLKALM
jgi:hypothetical protein